jgi:hypothetical protein
MGIMPDFREIPIDWDEAKKIQANHQVDYVGTPEPEMIDMTPSENKEVKFIASNKKWGKQ